MKLARLKPRTASFEPARKLARLEDIHDAKRLRGRALQERNHRLMQLNPLCVDCTKLGDDEARKQGYTIVVDEWDHERPLWKGGVDDETNLAGRCFKHHREKSERERIERQNGFA